MVDKLICPGCKSELVSTSAFGDMTCHNIRCKYLCKHAEITTWTSFIKDITALQKKLDRMTIAAQRCLNKFAHERIHAELKSALKEIRDIKE